MFSYQLDMHDMVTQNAQGEIKFDPPVWEQRYSATLRILEDRRWSSQLKKIVDFGCCEMRLLPLMRRIDTVEHIMEVDIDESTLVCNQYRGVPFTADYLKRRDRPLRVEILKGSIADSVENLRNVDVVIGLEIIEHLMQDVLEKVPQNIFGFIQPKLVIISTPNREYNVLFNGLNSNGFRIDDHKFEWTRKEFRDWAKQICQKYPNYSVAFLGFGSPPPQHKNIGHVTQMALFARNDLIDRPLKTPIATNLEADSNPDVQYKTIYAVDYPQNIDERTTAQKIKDEALNYIGRTQDVPRYFNRERRVYQIPIKPLNEYAHSINASTSDVLDALQQMEILVESEYIVLTEEYVEENYRVRGNDLYDDEYDEDFLNYEPYRYDEERDGETTDNTSKYVNCDEPEECWD